jgi:predicted TIM-barrel fold metal-dependent hydrolase
LAFADSHCHFFSPGFFAALGREAGGPDGPPRAIDAALGWEAPATDDALADRWAAELDRHDVGRAMLIASIPGDEASVSHAVRRHPGRFVGAFMFNPGSPDAADRLARAFGDPGLRTVCLFPAMHRVPLHDPATDAVFAAASAAQAAVFVHCGVLSIGVRKKLGLPSRFDLRLGDPLGVAAAAMNYPDVPVIIPHFGAGLFREALMAAEAAPNILLDTSSSNGWIRYHPGLTLRDVFARSLDVVGPGRLLFGTDSSFFPRGWQRTIFDAQRAIAVDLGLDADAQTAIFGGNFERIFADTRRGGLHPARHA